MKYHLSLGVFLSLIACFLYSLMTAIIKAKASLLPPLPVVVFLQNAVSLLLIVLVIYKKGHIQAKSLIKTTRLRLHLLRSIFSLLISYLLYYALQTIPLVNATLLANSAPLMVPVVGYLFFTEKINHHLWLAVIIGYIGVAFVLNPDSHFFNAGALLALGSAIALAFTIQCVRKLTVTDSTTTITFYFLFFSALISGILSIPFWELITFPTLCIMVMIGFLYFTSQYLANASLKYGNPQLISSLMYSNVVYATMISFFIWNTLPAISTWIGMLLIIIGGILCIRVEHRAIANQDNLIVC